MKDIDQTISEALEKKPGYELPSGFADRVVGLVSHKLAEKEAKRDRWWLIIGIASIVIAFLYVFAVVNFKPEVGVFTFFSGYKGLIIFGILFAVALHLVDKLILSKNRVDRQGM